MGKEEKVGLILDKGDALCVVLELRAQSRNHDQSARKATTFDDTALRDQTIRTHNAAAQRCVEIANTLEKQIQSGPSGIQVPSLEELREDDRLSKEARKARLFPNRKY